MKSEGSGDVKATSAEADGTDTPDQESGGRQKLLLGAIALVLLVLLASLLFGQAQLAGPSTILLFVLLALLVTGTASSPFSFTFWVAAFVSAAMFYPAAFDSWFGYELRILIVPLIQLIMFGMGTQLTVQDFKRVFMVPKAVLIGMVLQFSVMPFVGKAMAMGFSPNPEVAAGMVLVGSSPGGVASNVMVFLAQGNVALSVTMTACSTLAAPVMTSTMTTLLAGTYVEVGFLQMMISIINMVLIPITAGLLANVVLTKLESYRAMAVISALIMRSLPLVSMFGICFIIAIITAVSRDTLLVGGFVAVLIVAGIVHNLTGYVLGYWGARVVGLNEIDARTVSIEVGLQNAGMASGLAIGVWRSNLAALPPAIFGPVMNMSGAMLASWWSSHPVRPQTEVNRPAASSD